MALDRDASEALVSLWGALNDARSDQVVAEVLPACHLVGPVLSTVLFRAGIRTVLTGTSDSWDIAWLLHTATAWLPPDFSHLLALRETETLIRAEIADSERKSRDVRATDRNAFFTAQVATLQIFRELARAGRATALAMEIIAAGSNFRRDDWLLEELRRTNFNKDHPCWREGFEGLAVGVEALSRRMDG
ncbi:hypothetical protein ABH935_005037 [Catenulispora sp. GAS73]|uniref:hypothetical protein n=1 Tax=Catenulispora sp. GAS73 TaxID=3156269 RepID=UPI003515335A